MRFLGRPLIRAQIEIARSHEAVVTQDVFDVANRTAIEEERRRDRVAQHLRGHGLVEAGLVPKAPEPGMHRLALQGYARRTLRRMLSKAQAWGLLGAVPRIKLLKEARRTLLTDGERKAQLLKFACQPLRDVLIVMQDTGPRPEEVLKMRWEHIDWLRRTIFNPGGKTPRSRRMVAMSRRVLRVLKQRRGEKPRGWVFPSPRQHSKLGHLSAFSFQSGTRPDLV